MAASRTLGRSAGLVGLVLSLVGWTPSERDEEAPESQVATEYRRATETTDLRVEPISWVGRFARVMQGDVFEVVRGETDEGRGCAGGWLKVVGGGWACAKHTEVADAPPEEAPDLVDGLLPFVYAHRARNKAYSYGFRKVRGRELVRPGGRAHDAARYRLHDPSEFVGVDLREEPLPEGAVPAFTIRDGVRAISARSDKMPILALEKHTPLVVVRPASDTLVETLEIDGRPVHKHIDAEDALRVWAPAAPPEEVGADEVWIDVDIAEQMLAVRRGSALTYVTLISGGTDDRPTPLGIFHIDDKTAYTSMGSPPDASEPYFVEHVPWTMYFAGAYAIHGAYWHDEFGNPRSHGCINLAPRDARTVYGMVGPQHQPGFFKTWATETNPGSVVRIRDSD